MTIAHLSFTTSSRWGELGPARVAEAKATAPTAPHKTERTEAEREGGPRRSPLFGAIVGAIEDWVAQTQPPVGTDAASDAAAEGEAGSDSDALAQAVTEFARALMHALREGRGPHGEGRGLHLGHAYGRPGWGDATQRVEQLAQQFAPAPPTQPVEPPADTASAPLPVEPSEGAATIETPAPTSVETDPALPPVIPADTAATPSLHVTIDLGLPESPWKAVHDGLIESFAELQRAIGGPDTERDDKSLEEQLSDMLVALAVKLQTSELNTAALAPPGSLLSVVA
jgi:hypothetical protein